MLQSSSKNMFKLVGLLAVNVFFIMVSEEFGISLPGET